jgi:hypothetical protein
MYRNKIIIGGFVDGYYWSSSEYDSYGAWNQKFGTGYQNCSSGKDGSYYVRPVRAF